MSKRHYLLTATLTISSAIDPWLYEEKLVEALEAVLDTCAKTVLREDESACGFVAADSYEVRG